MTTLTIVVPRLKDSHPDFVSMAQIWRRWMRRARGAEVSFNFNHCEFLQPNAVVFLGGLARVIGYRGVKARFLMDTKIDRVRVKGQPHSFDEGTLLISQYLLWLDIESFAPAAV